MLTNIFEQKKKQKIRKRDAMHIDSVTCYDDNKIQCIA